MPEALHVTATARTIWDGSQVATALALAERQASRCARARALGRADREDLRQEILLAVVERAHRFDAAIAPWAAFVTLLARHAIADWLRAEQQRQSVAMLSLDEMIDGDAVLDAPAVDDTDRGADLRTALDAFLLDAPPSACSTLLLIAAARGDVAAAQRASGLPPSSFYRALAALRFWLHAAGLRTRSRGLGKNARVDR
jgi:DNA-directed RNA polymerase specialized sigma24 family protein